MAGGVWIGGEGHGEQIVVFVETILCIYEQQTMSSPVNDFMGPKDDLSLLLATYFSLERSRFCCYSWRYSSALHVSGMYGRLIVATKTFSVFSVCNCPFAAANQQQNDR